VEINETIDIRAAIRRRISARHYQRNPIPEEILRDVVGSGEKNVPDGYEVLGIYKRQEQLQRSKDES